MVTCPACHAANPPTANFCTSCGQDVRSLPVVAPEHLVDVDVGEEPTAAFDVPADPERLPTAGEVAAQHEVDLRECARCGAPNAAPRRRCGRCDAVLPVDGEPDLFDDPAGSAVPFDLGAAERLLEGGHDERHGDDESTLPPEQDDPTLPPVADDTATDPGMATPLSPVVAEPVTDEVRERARLRALAGTREPTGQLPVIERQAVGLRAAEPVTVGQPQRSRRWTRWAVGIVGVLAGTVLGWAVATGAGPFASTPEAVFRIERYPGDPAALGPVEATASTTAPGTSAAAAADGDHQTAWVAAADEDSPSLTLTLAEPVWLTSIVIATGEPASTGGPAGSGRVEAAFLELNGSRTASLVLRDVPDDQIIRLLTPALTDQVTITVDRVSDTGAAAVTEIDLLGHVADARDAVLLD